MPGVARLWLAAIRPKTLAAGAVPVAVGTLLAAPPAAMAVGPALAALAGALLLQIGCNFANEIGDAQRGADTADRVGPTRAVASGLISSTAMWRATLLVFALATLCGVFLSLHAGWAIMGIGAVSVLAALAYTLGPLPLAYCGLGEVFVFVFFGVVATLGAAWVQLAGQVPLARLADPPLLFCAAAIGLQATVLITINNLRDIATDPLAGKRTVAVRIGERATRVLVAGLACGGAACWFMAASDLAPEVLSHAGYDVRKPSWIAGLVASLGAVVIALRVQFLRGAALNGLLALSGAVLLLTGIIACVSLWR